MLRASNIAAAAPSAATERTNGPSGWQAVARMAAGGVFGTTAGANTHARLKPE